MGLSGAGAGPVGLGALAVFVGVAVLGPVIARPFAGIVGAPLPRLRGMAGHAGPENATRNPRRTAATASALMIGVALVAFITVFAASARASIATSIDKAMKSDWIVDTQFGMGGLSPAVTQRDRRLPETGSVTGRAVRRHDGRRQRGERVGVRPDQRRAEHPPRRAKRRRRTNLGVHDVAVQADEAKDERRQAR